jgi:hypothetical protein
MRLNLPAIKLNRLPPQPLRVMPVHRHNPMAPAEQLLRELELKLTRQVRRTTVQLHLAHNSRRVTRLRLRLRPQRIKARRQPPLQRATNPLLPTLARRRLAIPKLVAQAMWAAQHPV